MLTVGHGHFKSGRFTRISATSLSSCGGLVVVGPFSTTTNTSEEIRLAAYEKFCRQNRMFRKKYKSSDQLYLLFPDGSRVEGLPNRKDANFSIIEYRNFVDPTKRFDRLRLYLCDKVNFELSQPFTILTDSSSDENLPSLLMPTQKRDTPSPATCQKEANTSSDDDTLPLVIEVVFHHESTTISETFPNNTLGSVLIAYVAGLENLPVSSTVLRIKESDVIIQAEKRLFELTDLSSTIHVCVEQKTMGTDVEEVSNSLPIRAKYETENDEDVVAEGLVRHTLRLMDNVSEPKEILRRYQSVFLQGRTLDLTSDEETIEGETTPLYIRRVELFKDAVEELKYQENIRLPLEINFCGEAAQDLGGPRREFFAYINQYAKDNLLETYQNNVKLRHVNEEAVARQHFFYGGLLIGLGIIEGGERPEFLDSVLKFSEETEARTHFVKGLKRTGIWQLMQKRGTLKYLFQPTQEGHIAINKFIQTFEVRFSEQGSNKRSLEEAAYRAFVKYAREVYAGRREGMTLEKIMKFVCGAEKEPLLGFSMKPTIEFSAEGVLPTAATCIFRLCLPLNANVDLFDLAFMSGHFGMV
ncbi:uncharacterized protein LOC117340824 [Pecten maximus]|uniref:uncharacterized protein LOC117340824 n=1 Tax=Pecten maximus TaxID=6579 RepID=UPI001458B345|nr:uncharacterized protein LOC117340824 [Pecten maximus]XP_033758493.1 uncharacterized protein LOC117340824 [Pecten maximus]